MSTKRSLRPMCWLIFVVLSPTQHLDAASPVPLEQVRNAEPAAVAAAVAALPRGGTKPDRALLDALQEALTVKPAAVLRAIGDRRQMRLVCGPSVQMTYDLAENSLDERISAVASEGFTSTNSDDKKLLSACGDELQKAVEKAERRARAARAR